MTCWVLRAAGNRGFSPSTLNNGPALPIDLQRRAESHEETAPSRRDEIIATVTRPESTGALPASLGCECWITAEGRMGKRAGKRGRLGHAPLITNTSPAGQTEQPGPATRANGLPRRRGRIVIEVCS